jgi:hypothetical protein
VVVVMGMVLRGYGWQRRRRYFLFYRLWPWSFAVGTCRVHGRRTAGLLVDRKCFF